MKGSSSTTQDEPTRPGWYASGDPRLDDYLIFLLMADVDIPGVFVRKGQWMAFTQSGEVSECDWGYVAQVGPVVPLVRSASLERLAATSTILRGAATASPEQNPVTTDHTEGSSTDGR